MIEIWMKNHLMSDDKLQHLYLYNVQFKQEIVNDVRFTHGEVTVDVFFNHVRNKYRVPLIQ
jgi:hypothetical protein